LTEDQKNAGVMSHNSNHTFTSLTSLTNQQQQQQTLQQQQKQKQQADGDGSRARYAVMVQTGENEVSGPLVALVSSCCDFTTPIIARCLICLSPFTSIC
jgi:hypothetical protein